MSMESPMTLREPAFPRPQRAPLVLGAALLASTFVALTAAAPAQAQDNADSFTLPVERFRPAIDDKGLVTTESGSIPPHLGFQTGLDVNYALNPLVIRDGDGNFIDAIIAHRLAGDGLFTIGLFDY